MKKLTILLLASLSALNINAQQASWPSVKTEMKPAARWWWLGSAVDKNNLAYNISEYAGKGLGELEITPIYGVKDNDKNDIPYLSPKWMEMYEYTQEEGKRNNVKIDMNTGTGWPFGGPHVSIEDAATKAIFEEFGLKSGETLSANIVASDEKQKSVAKLSKLMAYSDKGEKLDLTQKVVNTKLEWIAPKGNWRLIAVFNGKTFQKVKRAAPGGEGYVMNHFSEKAVSNYLSRFTKAFDESKSAYPNSFFNDSYEVYGADWTPDMFEQFEKRRGYKLENFLPEFIAKERTDITKRIISDYRETLSELLHDNFTNQWTDWAHKHGSTTRNQAHGSPANLIDIYAAVDIPECESFGISDFHIKGLRTDTIKKINDSDLSMLKYASSAAHITGKPYTSSETFTWLTEHFRTSLSQCKPDLDLLFTAGVNHVFFHGITYSPQEAAWPGWKFYASVDMSPTNSIWHDADAFFDYITRSQSFLQEGKPDNDFLLYFPVYDMWQEQSGRLLMFDIHKMRQRAPKFISTVNEITNSGYDVDYISDKYLLTTTNKNSQLVTEGGTSYKAVIISGVEIMPLETLKHLLDLAQNGATLVFIGQYPKNVQGYNNLQQRQTALQKLINPVSKNTSFNQTTVTPYGKGRIITGSDYAQTLQACNVQNEEMKTRYGLQYIRRSNNDGHHYFISALQEKDTEAWITLAVDAKSAIFFNPLNGESGLAKSRAKDGKFQVFIQLKSGQSIILKTFKEEQNNIQAWKYFQKQGSGLTIGKDWKLRFTESTPSVSETFEVNKLGSWTDLNNEVLAKNMGTGLYSVEIDLPETVADDWLLNLGDVRESARVKINGKNVATLWSVPYEVCVGKYLQKGKNLIEIEVTNLPANHISDYDKRHIDWRIFKEINFVKIDYKKGDYSAWDTMPSGLLGPVTLSPISVK